MNNRQIASISHGMRYSPTYTSWCAMIQRCTNPNRTSFGLYGARGITVCKRWRTFANFLEDMGERPEGRTLDRRDNDGNYEPSNCRWATWSEQQLNRRPMTTETRRRMSAARLARLPNHHPCPHGQPAKNRCAACQRDRYRRDVTTKPEVMRARWRESSRRRQERAKAAV